MEPQPSSEHPWDIRPGEDRDWHYKFRLFVLAGPTRTLTKAYVSWLEEQGEAVPDDLLGPPALWRARSREYDWEDRAFAWDQHQLMLRERDLAAWKTKERERRQLVLDDLFDRLTNSYAAEVLDSADLKRVAEVAKVYMDQSREETGDNQPNTKDKAASAKARQPGPKEPSSNEEASEEEVDMDKLLDEYIEGKNLRDVANYGSDSKKS